MTMTEAPSQNQGQQPFRGGSCRHLRPPTAAAIDWYTRALGAVETIRYAGDDGRVGHAELRIDGADVMLSDHYPEIDVQGADPSEARR